VIIGECSTARTGDFITAVRVRAVNTDIDLELVALSEGLVGFLRCVNDYTFEIGVVQPFVGVLLILQSFNWLAAFHLKLLLGILFIAV
jgi:hypothetical protein